MSTLSILTVLLHLSGLTVQAVIDTMAKESAVTYLTSTVMDCAHITCLLRLGPQYKSMKWTAGKCCVVTMRPVHTIHALSHCAGFKVEPCSRMSLKFGGVACLSALRDRVNVLDVGYLQA